MCEAAQQLRGQLGDDWDRIKHMSIIDEDGGEKCATAHASCTDETACALLIMARARCQKAPMLQVRPCLNCGVCN